MNEHNTREKIMNMIKEGKVKVKSRRTFIISNALLFCLVFLLTLISIILVSYILFLIINTKLHLVPLFGLMGFKVLLFDLPWLMIFLALIALFILQMLIKHFSFSYKNPAIYSGLATVVVISALGIMIHRSGFHQNISKGYPAAKPPLPFTQQFYTADRIDLSPDDVLKGRVVRLIENGFDCETRDQIIRVVYTPQTVFPRGRDIMEGNFIAAIGEMRDTEFEAAGVIKIERPFFWKSILIVK